MYTDEMYHAAYNILSTREDQIGNELYHHGILGQKWGVRRYQNKDGSLTPAGRKRYYLNGENESSGLTKAGQKWKKENNGRTEKMKASPYDSDVTKKVKKDWNNMDDESFLAKYSITKQEYEKRVDKYGDPYANGPFSKKVDNRARREYKSNLKFDKRLNAFDRDIKSYDQIKDGFKDKNGRTLLTKDDVSNIVDSLGNQKISWALKNANTDYAKRTVDKLVNNWNKQKDKSNSGPMNERRSNTQPWDERPDRRQRGNI